MDLTQQPSTKKLKGEDGHGIIPMENDSADFDNNEAPMTVKDLPVMKAFLASIMNREAQTWNLDQHETLQKYYDKSLVLLGASTDMDRTDLVALAGLKSEAGLLLGLLASSQSKPVALSNSRVAQVDFGIMESRMIHSLDLDYFLKRVNNLFQWHENEKTQNEFMAPYFPLIQSSGTGKTKLLYEARRWIFTNQPDTSAELILCHDTSKPPLTTEHSVFTDFLDTGRKPSDATRLEVCRFLEDLANKSAGKSKSKVVFFFDESHFLASRQDGWHFHVIRWWLRRKHRTLKVVAVFAGTTAKIANFYADPPNSTTSRDPPPVYHTKGKMLFEPFFQLTTTGLFAGRIHLDPSLSEYHHAIPYGRPLFARMEEKNELSGKIRMIIRRMLGSNEAWKLDTNTCFAILGTRVQMGQVSFNMASNLVATGYAHLTSFVQEEQSIADIAFLPDPVCARIAMSLMVQGCCLDCDDSDGTLICGENPKFWTDRAKRIFSHGLCRPQKGDVGEIAVALYLLFCGDKIRHQQASDLTVFSISIQNWVETMYSHCLVSNDDVPHGSASYVASTKMSTRSSSESIVSTAPSAEATVNFIQVCRNYLRHSLESLLKHGMLEEWYKAGRAVYSFPSCPAYDILAPIRYGDPKDYSYCALMVSVKNRIIYSKEQRQSAVKAMENMFKNAGAKTGIGLLVLVGLEHDDRPLLTRPSKIFVEGKLTFAEVVVPTNDPFGVSLLAGGGGKESAEVYTSHAEVLISARLKPLLTWGRLLRSTTKTKDKSKVLLKRMFDAFKTSQAANFKNMSP